MIDFQWSISAAKRSELDIVLWGDWPRKLLKNLPYFVWLQQAILSTRHSFLAHERLYGDKQFYLPLPRSQLHFSCLYDGYVEYMIRVIKFIAKNDEMSIDQIGEATDGEFQRLFDCATAIDKDLENRLRRQRVLWVIEHVTMIELSLDSETFLSKMPTSGISSFLKDLEFFPYHEQPGERRSSASTLISSQRPRNPEVLRVLSQDTLNIHKLVSRHSIMIDWVDNPLLHLVIPSDSTLQLFWHASWCKSHSVASMRKHELSVCSTLRFPVSYIDEILRTYRLLFDEFSLASTQTYYRHARDPESRQMKLKCRDVFMDITCGMKHQSNKTEQGVFIDYARFEDGHATKGRKRKWTTADFPHFRERLEIVQETVESSKAAGFAELWKYEKGSMPWFAFW